MPRPVHFDIYAADPERAQRFYGALFGWRFHRWDGPVPYWLITTGDDGPGINGGLAQRPAPKPDPEKPLPVVAWTCTVQVDDVDAYVARALELGGGVDVPKMAIPGVGWLAYCKDTESNIFGLMQNDPAAA